MAPIRRIDQLEARLTEDLKWRTHEMDQWQAVASRVRTHEVAAIVRGGVAILYAHWEGYVKAAACSYLEFVANLGLKLDELRPELAAVAMRSVLGRGEMSKASKDHTEIVLAIRATGSPASLSYDQSTIRTYSNLSFERFEDIMHSLGCDGTRHEIYRSIIDNRLLKHRNSIAHGREEYVVLDDWITIKERVLIILQDVRTQLSNAATTASYRA
jgi:hypothetical protein